MRRPAIFVLIALAGCTETPNRYPSLLPRPIESQSFAEPERPVPVATPDAALDSQIAEITASLDANNQKFVAAAQDAEAKVAVARGVAPGSEAWLTAHAALSALESLRAPTLNALSELDRLILDRGKAGEPPYPALAAASERAEQLSNTQSDRIGALNAALAGA
ncbi:MAG: hypothetical protein J7500_08980 [Sphingomonas sp.]|uniref:hypothetical protein n=1 Tax=Sphingomonas sp. TaxID=28214 RepID=UPI001B01E74B|nr:hypothetical protein [Sphingomonas sp.]MBO9622833.1 hypothetical protein [Sphingomonas sp.]